MPDDSRNMPARVCRRTDRRGFVADGFRVLGVIGLGGVGSALALRGKGNSEEKTLDDGAAGESYVWQIDPDKCVACTKCQTECVLETSAAKCVQCFVMCGYCDRCTGYFPTTDYTLDTGAENHLCPTNAVIRTFVEEQSGTRYFEYTIDEDACVGCAKCVKGCALMNGSFYMQIRHDRCVNCNECAIAVACPAQAFRRVPAGSPYLMKAKARELTELHAKGLLQESQQSSEKGAEAE